MQWVCAIASQAACRTEPAHFLVRPKAAAESCDPCRCVPQSTCGLFSFSTFANSTGAYWAERWELYKHQYALARWAWIRGVRRIEFWCVCEFLQHCFALPHVPNTPHTHMRAARCCRRNEPDLNSPCMETNGVTDPAKYVEYYLVQSSAINNAFAGARCCCRRRDRGTVHVHAYRKRAERTTTASFGPLSPALLRAHLLLSARDVRLQTSTPTWPAAPSPARRPSWGAL